MRYVEPAEAARQSAFGELTITHSASVLEPRSWTVLQSEWAVEMSRLAPPGPILELCSGAGHIGLLAAHRSGRPLLQVDVNPQACADARANAAAAGLADRVEVRCAALDDIAARDGQYPLIIADPPYIATEGVQQFPQDPLLAIDGGRDGLELARECIEVVIGSLSPGGFALLQLGGDDQVDAIASFATPDLDLVGRRRAGPTRCVALFARAW
jgi:methylase of polypeptide subunit release factors